MSTPPRFFLDSLPDGELITLDGAEGHHAAVVRRIAVGEWITLGDGRGTVRDGEVVEVGRDLLRVRCGPTRTSPPPDPRLVVVQALAKGDRAELAVETMTELGVDEIIPWSATRCIVQWRGERGTKSQRRWISTAREAAKQSRRDRIPLVAEPHSTAEVLARIDRSDTALVLHESAELALASAPLSTSGEVLIVVGPEGGITDEELTGFGTAEAHVVRLGGPVLRTSTAGAAALAALAVRLDRWG